VPAKNSKIDVGAGKNLNRCRFKIQKVISVRVTKLKNGALGAILKPEPGYCGHNQNNTGGRFIKLKPSSGVSLHGGSNV